MLFFWEFSSPSRVGTEFETRIFFSLSRSTSSCFGYKYCRKEFFYNFEFFCYFFRNFLAWVECERNSGLNFFFLSLGLSHPVLARNNVGKWFFDFFNFFAIFFEIFLLGSSTNGFPDYFFFLFFSQSHPVLAKNNAGRWCFNFFQFF